MVGAGGRWDPYKCHRCQSVKLGVGSASLCAVCAATARAEARITTLEALLLEARTALEPMVPWWIAVQRTNYQDWIERHKDLVLYSCWYMEDGEAKEAAITVGDLRRAAEVYAKLPGGGQGAENNPPRHP